MSQGQGISWGKVVVGAAVVAGAVFAFSAAAPYLQEKIVPAIVEFGKSIGGGIASAWNWIGEHVIGKFDSAAIAAADKAKEAVAALAAAGSNASLPTEFAEHARTLLPEAQKAAEAAVKLASEKATGLAGMVMMNPKASIAAGAVAGGVLAASAGHAPAPEQESFTAREDARRMQSLMIARMQAAGYKPALAIATQRGMS